MTENSPALPWIPRARGRRRARHLYFLLHAGRHHQHLRRLKFLDSPCANCRTEPQHLAGWHFIRDSGSPGGVRAAGGLLLDLVCVWGAGLGGCPAGRWLLPDQGPRTGSQRIRTAARGLWGRTGGTVILTQKDQRRCSDSPRSFAPPSPTHGLVHHLKACDLEGTTATRATRPSPSPPRAWPGRHRGHSGACPPCARRGRSPALSCCLASLIYCVKNKLSAVTCPVAEDELRGHRLCSGGP